MSRIDKILKRTDITVKPFVGAPIANIDGYINARRANEGMTPELEKELRLKYTPPPTEPKLSRWTNPVKFSDDVIIKIMYDEHVHVKLFTDEYVHVKLVVPDEHVHVKLVAPFDEAIPYLASGERIPLPVYIRCLKRCGAPDSVLFTAMKRQERISSPEFSAKLNTWLESKGSKPVKKVLKSVKKNIIPK
jgi:hypothetical protein